MKLNVKLTIVVFTMALFCSCLIAFISFSSIKNTTITDSNESLQSLIKTVENTASTAAFVNNEELAREVVLGLEENAVVSCAEIVTETMQARIHNQCYGGAPITSQLLSPFDNNEIVGKIKLYANQNFITKKSRQTFYNQAISMLLIVLLTTSIILISTYLLITEPLTQLSQNLRDIDLNRDTQKRLKKSNRKDEIETISDVINALLDNASNRIQKEQNLTKKSQLLTDNLKMIFDLSKNAIAVTDENLNLISYNPEFKQFLYADNISNGSSDNASNNSIKNSKKWINNLLGKRKDIENRIHHLSKINIPESFEAEMNHTIDNEIMISWFNVTYVKTQVSIEPIDQIDEEYSIPETNILFFIDDITEHKLKLEQSEYAADHDSLTKLLNRRSASRILRRKLKNKATNYNFALIMIDLDGFKPINDNHGHNAGDYLLKIIARRLENSTRKSDIICRWGGDEFLVCLNEISEDNAVDIAQKILSDMLEPVIYLDKKSQKEIRLKIGSSIGIAFKNETDNDLLTLIDHADKAMYTIKNTGKNGVHVYNNKT